MNKELKTIGPEIAKHLGWNYVEDGDYRTSFLVPGATRERGGKSMHLQVAKGRLHVSGTWPYSKSGYVIPRDVGGESPSITISLDKEPQKIAADIQRRFLPKYLDLYAKCVERVNQREAAQASQLKVAAEFAEIVGDKTTNARANWYGENCYGQVDVNAGGDSATLAIHGDVEILKAALRAAVKMAEKLS